MPPLILGPPGVLPWLLPAGSPCAVPVFHEGWGHGTLVAIGVDGYHVYFSGSTRGLERVEDRNRLRLDLTRSLDHGTRALLYLLTQDVFLCAPLWSQNSEWARAWSLQAYDNRISFIESDGVEDEPGVLYEDYVHVPGICGETGPGKALVLALETVSTRTKKETKK